MIHNSLANLLSKISRRIWLNKWPIIIVFTAALLGILGCTFANSGAEDTASFGALDRIWRAILKTTAASILSILTVFAIAVFWILWRNSSIEKWIYEHKRIIYALLVLALLIPVVPLLLKGASSPLMGLAAYARELLVSVVFVVSVSATLKVLDLIDRRRNRESGQLISWEKWLRGDEAGWHELWEEVCFNMELTPAVRSAVERELRRVQQGESEAKSSGYEERLRLLLLSPSQVGGLSSGERVAEKEIASPGFVHSGDFIGYIAEKLHSSA